MQRALRNIRPRSRRSLHLDIGRPDHLAPLLGLIGDELSELDSAHRHRHMAYLSHPRLDLGFDETGVDLTIERLDDLGRRSTRGDIRASSLFDYVM